MSIGTQIYCTRHRRHDLDSCEMCDQETANPTYYRGLRVSVYVDKNYLTNEGEDKEEDGWKELEEELRKRMAFPYLRMRDVKLVVEEWEADPNPATESELRTIGRLK